MSGSPGTSEPLSERHNLKKCWGKILSPHLESFFIWEMWAAASPRCRVRGHGSVQSSFIGAFFRFSVHTRIAEPQNYQLPAQYLQGVQGEHRASVALASITSTREKSQAKNKARNSKTLISSALCSRDGSFLKEGKKKISYSKGSNKETALRNRISCQDLWVTATGWGGPGSPCSPTVGFLPFMGLSLGAQVGYL